MKRGLVLISLLFLLGCQRGQSPKEAVVQINDYQVTAPEFEQGFARSIFASSPDKVKARADYLESLIDQKLILQDAQNKNLDKDENFMRSIEHFWEQSLLTVALKVKGNEIARSVATKELEQEKMEGWVRDLRKEAVIKVNKDFLKTGK